MKKLVAVLAVLAVVNASSRTFAADGTINLTNYDSNNPILYNPTGVGAAVNLPVANSFVQVLGGPLGGSLVVLSSSAGGNIFPLAEPGFFDGGFGFVPGAAEGGQGSFQVRAWRSAATFDAATPAEKGSSAIYQNAIGTAGTPGPPPGPPIPSRNTMPTFTVGIPEPSTMILGLLGATVLLFRRRQH